MAATKKHRTLTILIAVCLMIAILCAVFLPRILRRADINRQFEIAQIYLNELDYESAILAFTKVLEIDPNNEAAQQALFDAYHQMLHSYLDAEDARAEQAFSDMKAALSLTSDVFLVTTEAAKLCGENDYKIVICNHCGAQWRSVLQTGGDASGTSDDGAVRHIIDGTQIIEKACGVKIVTCQCGEIITEDVTGEHVWDGGVVTVETSFEAPGEVRYTCTGCGDTKIEEIPMMVDEELIINDPNLEAALREEIDKMSGPLMLSDFRYMDFLQLNEKGITDLSGLTKLTQLRVLELESNPIRDLTPLSSLYNLETLDLSRCGLRDISALSSLTKLEKLFLNFNEISDLSPLASMKNLRILELRENQVSDLTPLTDLRQMTRMYLEDNQIKDLSPLSGMVKMGCLMVDDNQISDLSPLASMTQLDLLSFNDNQISDLSALSSMTAMCDLRMVGNQITDISPLANMEKLERVQMGGNQISNLEPLRNLKHLARVFLYNNPITDFSPVDHVEIVAY
ncbi:MAG: hypothetical protein E7604_07185 [Ruminococcaceae bacterium]|nr:hypothetical protein [Oscillospiraceae bacterium]